MRASAALTVSIRAYADLLRRWAGGDDDRVVELTALYLFPALRAAALECASAADAVTLYLRLPAAERRRHPPLLTVLQTFAQAHHPFGTTLRLVVRAVARSGD